MFKAKSANQYIQGVKITGFKKKSTIKNITNYKIQQS